MVLACDASSNIGSKSINWDKYGIIYAHSQKNLGPSGVCVAAIRNDIIGDARPDTPFLCDWKEVKEATDSYPNTPTCWSIYVMGLVLDHMIKKGGVRYYDNLA